MLVQGPSLWACLGFAVIGVELGIAETAFAGGEEVDKLQYTVDADPGSRRNKDYATAGSQLVGVPGGLC